MCSVKGCEKPIFNKGRKLCSMHYARWQRHGSTKTTLKMYARGTPEERFMAYIRVIGECWIWQGVLDKDGYAYLNVDGKRMAAYRWAYEHWVGPIPNGMYMDHFMCERKDCVNPQHVRPVSPRENVLRSNSIPALNLAKTHCKRGHEFSPENTYVFAHNGQRRCRRCHTERARKEREQQKRR